MKTAIVVMLIASFLTSCGHVYYAANPPNLPQLCEKGEGRLTAAFIHGDQSGFNGGGLQFAYAPLRYIGLMGSFFAAGGSAGTRNNTIESGRGSYGELGLGVFRSKPESTRLSMEIFAGRGIGLFRNGYEGSDFSKVKAGKWFLQPDLGYRGNRFDIVFTPRISFINWKIAETRFNEPSSVYDEKNLDAIRAQKRFLAFEPGMIFRAGAGRVSGHFGVSLSYNNLDLAENMVPTQNLVASLGIIIQLKPKR